MEATIPIEIYEISKGYHMAVSILINNKPAKLILDTGASVSVFDEERVADLVNRKIKSNGAFSAGAGGNIEQKEVMIAVMQIGFLYMEDYNAAVMNLSHINESYKEMGLNPVDGILGNDILKFYDASIDFKKKELLLRNF